MVVDGNGSMDYDPDHLVRFDDLYEIASYLLGLINDLHNQIGSQEPGVF